MTVGWMLRVEVL